VTIIWTHIWSSIYTIGLINI